MNLREAKKILNKNNYILEASYKDLLQKSKQFFGDAEKTITAIEDYININAPEDAKEFIDTYGIDGRKMVETLIYNSRCLKALNIPNADKISYNWSKNEDKFRENLNEFYLNDPETKNELIEFYLEYTKETQDKLKENESLVLAAGAKRKDYEYKTATLKTLSSSKYLLDKTLLDTTINRYELQKKGIICPVFIEITGKDVLQYFEEHPEALKKYGNYYADKHQYSRFIYGVDNNFDTFSFEMGYTNAKIGNTDALQECKDDKVIKEYLIWRSENHGTWEIPYDMLVKVIKAFLSYPSKLTDEELKKYKKDIQLNDEYAAGVAEFYATTRYQGD